MHFCTMNMGSLLSGGLLQKQSYFIDRLDGLQRQLLLFSFFNLFLTACIGLLLRSFHFLDSFPLQYKNILHGHSHFAFGGWIMPVLLALLLKCMPELAKMVAYRHWRNIAVLMLVSAYGMLVAFPIQGYKAVSITFSTLSLISGFYLAAVVWKSSRKLPAAIHLKFLSAGLFYHVLSSAGPFATAPLIIMGKAGTPLYFDVIYFFLHFQYNGFFTFTVLAIIYKLLDQKKPHYKNARLVFLLFHLACIPAYFLSILWHKPSLVFNVVGGLAAAFQVVALFLFARDAIQINWKHRFIKFLFLLSLSALVLKIILQFFSAFPVVAAIGYQFRNFVIAYLHLVLIGFISLFSFAAAFETFVVQINKGLQLGVTLFLIAFFTTELLLVVSGIAGMGSFRFPGFTQNLLIFSCLFPAGLLILFLNMKKQLAQSSSR